MANMFSGKSGKEIPKNLSDCIKPDSTVVNLHTWAERLERLGKILFFVLVVVGFIASFMDASHAMQTNDYYNGGYENDSTAWIVTFITSVFSWALYAFIEYCVYHVLALLIDALASITKNTIVSANVALLTESRTEELRKENQDTSSAQENLEQPARYTTPSRWMCSCGQTNDASASVCRSCGKSK